MKYKVFASSALVLGLTVGAFAGKASAHHPEVSASAKCTDNAPTATITTTSWATDSAAHRANSNIGVTVDGVPVGSGAFTNANGYTFTLVVPTTPGSHTVRATALAPFGPAGQFGNAGEWRETTFIAPDNCAPPPTTVPPTTLPPVTTLPPTTTVPTPKCYYEEGGGKCDPLTPPPTTIAPPPTTVPTWTITPPTTVPAVPFAPPTTLAFTGSHTALLFALAVALLALGLGARGVARRL